MTNEVLIVGGGIAGMATAARLQARGVQTMVLEAHTTIGGCAGYFRHQGFSFDVGATTFVDFAAGGVGAQFCEEIGMDLDGDILPGYVAWLPDRTVTLHRDRERWHEERISAFGRESAPLWAQLDRIADVFWAASRKGIRLPFRRPADLLVAVRSVSPADWPMARYLRWTFADALAQFGQQRNTALRSTCNMLIQDTLHSSVEEAPLVNAALGISIRGAGLTRPHGGARGFFSALGRRYVEMGGEVRRRTVVKRIESVGGRFRVVTDRGEFLADSVVSTLPLSNLSRLVDGRAQRRLARAREASPGREGGAVVLHLAVPEHEVAGHDFTHHQILHSYGQPLGDGNNMFISVSSPGDRMSAPEGYRAVMISTHCELERWNDPALDYPRAKAAMVDRLLDIARRVYPSLGDQARYAELGTPRTYARFTGRDLGGVGGLRQTMRNTNLHAIGHSLGVRGLYVAGDGTWPGLGTVAAMMASKTIAESIAASSSAATAPMKHQVTLPVLMPAVEQSGEMLAVKGDRLPQADALTKANAEAVTDAQVLTDALAGADVQALAVSA